MGEWVPSNSTLERVLIANKMANDLSVPIVISGGKTIADADSEASVVRRNLKLYNSLIEQDSLNTYESAINLKTICAKQNGLALLITSELHSLRSYLTFKTQGCNVLTYDYQNKHKEKKAINMLNFIPSLNALSKVNALIYEYIALIYYLVTA